MCNLKSNFVKCGDIIVTLNTNKYAFQCNKCSKIFHYIQKFMRHLVYEHNGNLQNYNSYCIEELLETGLTNAEIGTDNKSEEITETAGLDQNILDALREYDVDPEQDEAQLKKDTNNPVLEELMKQFGTEDAECNNNLISIKKDSLDATVFDQTLTDEVEALLDCDQESVPDGAEHLNKGSSLDITDMLLAEGLDTQLFAEEATTEDSENEDVPIDSQMLFMQYMKAIQPDNILPCKKSKNVILNKKIRSKGTSTPTTQYQITQNSFLKQLKVEKINSSDDNTNGNKKRRIHKPKITSDCVDKLEYFSLNSETPADLIYFKATSESCSKRTHPNQASIDVKPPSKLASLHGVNIKSNVIQRSLRRTELQQRMSNIKKRIIKSLHNDSIDSQSIEKPSTRQLPKKVEIEKVEILPNTFFQSDVKLDHWQNSDSVSKNKTEKNCQTGKENLQCTSGVNSQLVAPTVPIEHNFIQQTNKRKPAAIVKPKVITKPPQVIRKIKKEVKSPIIAAAISKVSRLSGIELKWPNATAALQDTKQKKNDLKEIGTDSIIIKQNHADANLRNMFQHKSAKIDNLETTNWDLTDSVVEYLEHDLKSDSINVDSILNIDDATAAKRSVGDDNEMMLCDDILIQLSKENAAQITQTSDKYPAFNTSLHNSSDEKLVRIIGFDIISNSNCEDALNYDDFQVLHKLASQFAQILQEHSLLWKTLNNEQNMPQKLHTEFSKMLISVNRTFVTNLNLNDLKRVVNLVIMWYTQQCDSKMLLKKQIPKSYEFYLKLLSFMPKTTRRRYYCEYCNDYFTSVKKYVTHRTNHTSIKPHQCTKCPKTYSMRRNLLKHENTH